MEDDLEELVLKQAYSSHLKIVSRLVVSTFGFFNKLPSSSFFNNVMKSCLRPEVIFLLGTFIILICFYFQAYELDTNGLLNRVSSALRFRPKKVSFVTSVAEKDSWELLLTKSAAYSIQGRRNNMEDR